MLRRNLLWSITAVLCIQSPVLSAAEQQRLTLTGSSTIAPLALELGKR